MQLMDPLLEKTINYPSISSMTSQKIYLIGSLRNPRVPEIAKYLRKAFNGQDPALDRRSSPFPAESTPIVFDDWYAAGPEADDYWKEYEISRGRSYTEALGGEAAKHVFDFDKRHLDSSSHALLVLPAGKSAHLEIAYAAYGVGCHTAVLLDTPDRWDVMYKFIPDILEKEIDIVEWFYRTNSSGKRQSVRGF